MGEQKVVELKVKVPEKVVAFAKKQLIKDQDEHEYWASILLRGIEADADKERLLTEYLAVLKQHEATDEFEKVEVRIPARIVRFLEAFGIDVPAWAEEALIDYFVANSDLAVELWSRVSSELRKG